MSTPTRRSRASKASLPSKSATGATTAPSTVAEVICPSAPRRNLSGSAAVSPRASVGQAPNQHQTHGAVTPLTGAISNVSQLVNGGRSLAKGSASSFETLAAYTAHLRTLDLHGLHRHAREDAKVVPIDDRERLIRRLETAWTATAARQSGRSAFIPSRVPFTQEQIEAQAEIERRLLRR